MNRSLDIFANFWSPISQPIIEPLPGALEESLDPIPSISAAACRHGTGPYCPILIALSPFHYGVKAGPNILQ